VWPSSVRLSISSRSKSAAPWKIDCDGRHSDWCVENIAPAPSQGTSGPDGIIGLVERLT
jgi:hypothetical protein